MASPQQAIFANQTSRHFSRGPETLLPVCRFVRALGLRCPEWWILALLLSFVSFFVHGAIELERATRDTPRGQWLVCGAG